MLASGSNDTTVKVWDIITGLLVTTLEHSQDMVYSVCFVSDNFLATGSDGKVVRVWNVDTGGLMQSLEGLSGHVHSVAVSEKKDVLVFGSLDGTVKVWSAAEDSGGSDSSERCCSVSMISTLWDSVKSLFE